MDLIFFIIFTLGILFAVAIWNGFGGRRHRISPFLVAFLLSAPLAFIIITNDGGISGVFDEGLGLFDIPEDITETQIEPEISTENETEGPPPTEIQNRTESVFDTSTLDTGDLLG